MMAMPLSRVTRLLGGLGRDTARADVGEQCPSTDQAAPQKLITQMDEFLVTLRAHENFAWSKINHGFWEFLADVQHKIGWPGDEAARVAADKIIGSYRFFEGGFVDDLLALLKEAAKAPDPALQLAYSLSAWPDDNRIIGTPHDPERVEPLFLEYCFDVAEGTAAGLMLKRAIHDGQFARLLEEIRNYHVIFVGPEYLKGFLDFARVPRGEFIPIHATRATELLHETEALIAERIRAAGGNVIMLLQAGPLATYWILRLRPQFPQTRWIDGGLAFSICFPEDILKRPWGMVYRKEIVQFYNKQVGKDVLSEHDRLGVVEELLQKARNTHVQVSSPMTFVDAKRPDGERISQFLNICERDKRWANGGSLYWILAEAYEQFMKIPADRAIVPCANGGLALEALARLQEMKARQRIRWAASAFTFKNIGRGYFHDAVLVDCDTNGMLSLESLKSLDPDSFGGIVVTNIFGLWVDFAPYIEFARRVGKPIIIDNAAGVGSEVPEADYQAFSLHHTKPFGFGEGGLALVPRDETAAFFSLLEYGDLSNADASHWVNNGKLSDLSCAYLLDRLERVPEWGALYKMQAWRITSLCERAGLKKLLPFPNMVIAASLPFLASRPIAVEKLSNTCLVLGKYYKPIAHLPMTLEIYGRLINVPCHPEVAEVPTGELLDLLRDLSAS